MKVLGYVLRWILVAIALSALVVFALILGAWAGVAVGNWILS